MIAHGLACLLVGRKMWLKVAHLFATARAGIPNSVMNHPCANGMANSGKNNVILASEEGGRHASGRRPGVNIRYASGKATPEVTFAFWESVSQHRKERISKLCKKWREKCVSLQPKVDVFGTGI